MNTRASGSPLTTLPIRYLLVIWLFVLSAVAFLDRTNISIAGVQISREFHIDNTRFGIILSAFLIGYALFQIPCGILAKRLGPRLVLTIGVLWWGTFTVLTALASPAMPAALPMLIAVRLALGAGEAAMYPATSQFVERWFPVQERGFANGLIFGGVGAGSGITPPLVTAIMLRYGWRASFWLSAAIGAVAGLIWFLIARNRPEQHPWVQPAELRKIQLGRDSNAIVSNLSRASWLKILAQREILALALSYFSFGYVAWVFFGWLYIYLAQVRGLDLRGSAFYSMLPFLAMTVGCLGGGAGSDWLTRHFGLRVGRSFFAAAALITTSILLLFGSRASHVPTGALLLACAAGTLYLSQSCYWAVAADIAAENASIASSLMNMGGQLGGATTASLTPYIASRYGWSISFLTAAILAIAGGLTWLIVNPTRNRAA